MRTSVGIDIAKEIHWVTAIDTEGIVLLDHKFQNRPSDIANLIEELNRFDGEVRIGLDVVGGIAGLVEAMLAAAGFTLVHVPGLSVNRARRATVGGENKSDPRDARTIAEQVLMRRDLRVMLPLTELDIEIRLLVGRRSELVVAQTRRVARLRDYLVGIFPELEKMLDLTTKGPLHLLSRYVTPAELRTAGKSRLTRHMRAAGQIPKPDLFVERVLTAAAGQTINVLAEQVTARLIREIAAEAFIARARILEIEKELAALLDRHPDAMLIRSLPGMGTALTAELIAEAGDLSRFHSADALASAGGIAPVLHQSGKVRFLRRAMSGNKALKRVFYQSAFSSLHHANSRAFYDRKRREGKRHHQAIIALARRRVNVLWAIMQTRTPYRADFKKAA